MEIKETVGSELNARPFQCSWQKCNKGFTQRSDLQRHNRIHTNERPYSCIKPGCGKSFIQRSALKVHIRTHTGERPHQCDHIGCGKRFSDVSSLARHRRVHTGVRLYECQYDGCTKSFVRNTTLLKHRSRSHQQATHLSELDYSDMSESEIRWQHTVEDPHSLIQTEPQLDQTWPSSSHLLAHRRAVPLTQPIPSQDCQLTVIQEPVVCKVSVGKEKDRKPVDPPPVVQLKVSPLSDPNQNYLQSSHFFLKCSLYGHQGQSLAGTLVSSLHHLKDLDNKEGAFFVFGDVSIKVEGTYRLQFDLYEMQEGEQCVHICGTTSKPFPVVSSKNFYGMPVSTGLTRTFNEQGVRLRLQKEHRSLLKPKGPGTDKYKPRNETLPSPVPDYQEHQLGSSNIREKSYAESLFLDEWQAKRLRTGSEFQDQCLPPNQQELWFPPENNWSFQQSIQYESQVVQTYFAPWQQQNSFQQPILCKSQVDQTYITQSEPLESENEECVLVGR